jgi:hypothetical protein
VLSPEEAVVLLRTRVNRLDMELTGRRSVHTRLDGTIPRLFSVEYEYKTKLLEAELDWLRTLVADIDAGTLGGMEFWSGIHGGGDPAAMSPTDDERHNPRKGQTR